MRETAVLSDKTVFGQRDEDEVRKLPSGNISPRRELPVCEIYSQSPYLCSRCVCVCEDQSINSQCVRPPERLHYNTESSGARGLLEERLSDAVS